MQNNVSAEKEVLIIKATINRYFNDTVFGCLVNELIRLNKHTGHGEEWSIYIGESEINIIFVNRNLDESARTCIYQFPLQGNYLKRFFMWLDRYLSEDYSLKVKGN